MDNNFFNKKFILAVVQACVWAAIRAIILKYTHIRFTVVLMKIREISPLSYYTLYPTPVV